MARGPGARPDRPAGAGGAAAGPGRPGADGSSFEARWRQRFEDFARSRDDDAGIAGWTASGLATRLRLFEAHAPLDLSGQRWLDAGCGAGSYTRVLTARGAEVVALDYSWPTLAKARQRCDPGVAFVAADVRRLPFPPATFDGVLCLGVTQALDESTTAVRELASLLRPGGTLWIDALNAGCLVHVAGRAWRSLRGRGRHLRYERPGVLANALSGAGLVGLVRHWLPIVPVRWAGLQRIADARPARTALQAIPGAGLVASHSFVLTARRPAEAEA